MSYFDKNKGAWHSSLFSLGSFKGWLLSFVALLISLLAVHVWFEYQNFSKTHQQFMRRTVSQISQQIRLTLDRTTRSLELLALNESSLIASLVHQPQSQHEHWPQLYNKLRILFSKSAVFAITDINQKPLFISSHLYEDLATQPFTITTDNRLTGCKQQSEWMEFSVYWTLGAEHGFLVACESLQVFTERLSVYQTETFDMLLLSKPSDLRAKRQEVKDIVAEPIDGKPWQVAAVPNPLLFRNNLMSTLQHISFVYLVFLSLCGALAYRLVVLDRKRREAEQAWQSLHARAQATLASIGDGVIVTDVDRTIEYINPVAERMTGWEQGEAVGQPLDYICPIHEKAQQGAFLEFTEVEQAPARYQVVIQKNNKSIFVEQSSTLLHSEENIKPGIVWVLRDISETQEAMYELSQSEERYRLLATNMHDVVWTLDLNLELVYLSPSVETLLGYPPEIFFTEKRREILPKTYFRQLLKVSRKIFKKSNRYSTPISKVEIQAKHSNGHAIWLEINFSVIRDSNSQPRGILCLARDSTARKESEAELRLSAIVFENSFEGIMITDAKGAILRTNKAFTRITGYLFSEVYGKNARLLQSGRHNAEFFSSLWKSLEESGYWNGEIWNKRRNGEVYPQKLSISVIKSKEGTVLNYIGILEDITEKKQTEERIHRLAYYDELTELPNRVLFQERLKRALVHAKRNNRWVGLLFLDLDRFKSINDTMGHPAGDQLLRLTAERLKNCVREEDTVVRMGGDEFILILFNMKPNDRAHQGAQKVARKVLTSLSQPFSIGGREVFIGASIGVAFYPQDGTQSTQLLKNADLALYHAKALGRNNAQFYTEEIHHKMVSRIDLENELRRAVQSNELQLYYQPQACIETGRLSGVECLLRWYSPQRGLILPSEFISIAEESKLISAIGEWTLRTACQQASSWLKQGYRLPSISVNISGKQVAEPKIFEQVQNILLETGLSPHHLDLEITESILVEDITTVIETLKRLKSIGIRISIDDFGTGYSSLSYLKRFPIDTLKIDRAFVRDITVDADDAEMIAAIIALAQNLNLGIVAEGVETWGQLEFLRHHHCRFVQGYLISHPLPPPAMTKLLAQGGLTPLYQQLAKKAKQKPFVPILQ